MTDQPRRVNLLSVVIPTLNAAEILPPTVHGLEESPHVEIIVADGGSTDGTRELAIELGARVVGAPADSCGARLAAGCAAAVGGWLLLLRPGVRLAPGWRQVADDFIDNPMHALQAGYFRLTLDEETPGAQRAMARTARVCRAFGLSYGEQGLLLSRPLLRQAGWIKPLPMMEDLDLARRIGRTRLVALDHAIVVPEEILQSGSCQRNRFQNNISLFLWWFGIPSKVIAAIYSEL
ncbi:MAG TPA: glycosyltransferase [Acetobacteraceae bacterium]|nr:glycosyltransferase [Acetobacteraceae bacterium]